MLVLREIKKDYLSGENTVHALKGISVIFGKKGLVSIFGQSGCGKTTLLNIIGGLDKYSSGDLVIDGISTKDYKDSDWDAYRNKHIGFIFQSYNLIPHLTCLQNVALSQTVGGESISNSNKKALNALKQMGLEKEIKKFPNQMSGGQQQRVAVARALINNPDVILADEPTGALDVENSESLMQILKEISKEHLVIMVTHNQELAEKYSDRIIRMSDGLIIDDTDLITDKEQENLLQKHEKSGFSLRTAFKLAGKTLLTKKGRTGLTAFASSIGIIGVGLVLALSNGFENYVNKVQTETSANMPIVVSSTQTSYAVNPDYSNYEKFPKTDEIIVYDTSTSSAVVQQTITNNLTEEYVDYVKNIDNNPKYKGAIGSTLVNYAALNRNIISKTADGLYQMIDPDTSVSGSSVASIIAQISGLPRSILHEFYGNEKFIRQSYEVLYGTYPQDNIINDDTFEIALVLDSYNRIETTTLRRMGFYSYEEIQSMVENKQTIKFSEFVGKEYTFYLTDDIYLEDQAIRHVATDRTSEKQTISIKDQNGELRSFDINIPINSISQYRPIQSTDLVSMYKGTHQVLSSDGKTVIGTAKPYHLKVSSIMRVKEDSLVDYMPASLCYTQAFKDFCYEKDTASKVAQSQNHKLYANLDVYNLQSLFNLYNSKNCYSLFVAAGLMDESEQPEWSKSLPNATQSDLTNAFNNCCHWYSPYANVASDKSLTFNNSSWLSYSDFVRNVGKFGVNPDEIDYSNVLEFMETFSDLIKAVQDGNTVQIALQTAKLELMLHNDTTLIPMMFTYLAIKLSNYTRISSIIIFPKSLETKPLIKEYLDEYNAGKTDAEKVTYADYVGEFTESLYTIISVISIVLVAFSSISLIVSSLMSGVITYTSVIERTKEIGVYRAIGAKKRDVAKLFILENIIIGAISGLIGIGAVYILSIPINAIIGSMFAQYNIGMICNLSILTALALVGIAVLLAFIASIVPSRVAANKDPVTALRTE